MLLLIKNFCRDFCDIPAPIAYKERLRVFLGICFGLLVTALISRWFIDGGIGAVAPAAWLVAPIGASAVIIFAFPASPLSKPWAVLAGNTISALVGVACVKAMVDPVWAATVAVGGATGCMLLLRCLHPPGGAIALLVVILQVSSYKFALYPVLLNSFLLVVSAIFYNKLTGQKSPSSYSSSLNKTATPR